MRRWGLGPSGHESCHGKLQLSHVAHVGRGNSTKELSSLACRPAGLYNIVIWKGARERARKQCFWALLQCLP